ncbi:protein SSUH2 homolog [Styela clava]
MASNNPNMGYQQQGYYPPPTQAGGYTGQYQQQPQQYQQQPQQYQQQPGYAPLPQGPYQPQPGYAPAGQVPPNAYAPPGAAAPPQAYPAASGDQGQVTEKTPWNPNQATAYSGPDLPTDDVMENQAGDAPATAPPPSYDLAVSGYENVGVTSDNPVGPPPAYEPSEMVEAKVDTSKMPTISDDEARDALLVLVNKSACWGAGAAKKMKLKDMIATNAYHYTLETYTEGRTTKYAQTPFRGGYVDGPENGQAPLPWEISCNSTALFKTEQHKIPVPHTEVVKTCNCCWGRGFNRCTRCHGRGNVRCSFCHGSGTRHVHNSDGHSHHAQCTSCHGRGRKRCITCHGSGCVLCIVCAGYGNVKQFIQLTVLFTNRLSDHIVERTDLPNELIRNVQGDEIFQQTYPRVSPIENFFETEINQRSLQLVNTHASSWPAERILQQRHVLRSVPVHECHFEFKDKPGRFWVYGHQREVYTTDYPHTCCCCQCAIL